MKDLKEILDKSPNIILLAERFGFDSEIRILVEEGSEKNEKTFLNFLVRIAPEKDVTVYHTTLLSVKLIEMLGCAVFITLYEGVKDFHKDKVTKRSLPLTASQDAFCKLFAREDIEEIFFEKPSKHIEKALLNEANKFLDEHPPKAERFLGSSPAISKKTSSFENLKSHTLLSGNGEESNPKKHKDGSHSPNEDSTVSPPKHQSPSNTRK